MEEKVYFKNSRGDKLCGLLSLPKGSSSDKIVILCHGLKSQKNSGSNLLFVNEFSKENFATLRFDFHGHGESENSSDDILVSAAVDDVLSAITFVKKKGFSKIGLVGSSFGGLACILACTSSKDVFALGLKSPAVDDVGLLATSFAGVSLSYWKSKGVINLPLPLGFSLKYSYYKDASKYNVLLEAEKISVPTIIIHGRKDDIVHLSSVEKFNESVAHSKLVVFPGSDHFFKHSDDKIKMVALITDFMVNRL